MNMSVLDTAMKSGSCPKTSCQTWSQLLRVSLSLAYGGFGRVGEEEGCVPVLSDEWTYLLVGMVKFHVGLCVKVVLVYLDTAEPLAFVACAHIDWRDSRFSLGATRAWEEG